MPGNRGVCTLCGAVMALGQLIGHLKDEHPEEYELAGNGDITWPDGEEIDRGWLEGASPEDFEGD